MGGGLSCCEEDGAPQVVEVAQVGYSTASPQLTSQEGANMDEPSNLHSDVKQGQKKLMQMRQFQVDAEVVRGLPLQRSLRGFGQLWRRSPLDLDVDKRARLWDWSQQVTHFDVFLSHTWQTPGHWKVLSLLLQAGWKYMLLMWAASAFLIRILDLVSVLPMPSDCRFRAAKFEHVCSYFPWCLAASLPVQLLALLMTPYLPYLPNITYSSCFKRWTLQKEEDKGAHKNGTGDVHEGDGQNDSRRTEKQSEEIEMSLDRKPFASDAHDIVNGSSKKEKQMQQICFLDVACIHQTDHELMERGVYGLGAFLKRSKELRILWSPPYLTRLWCIFELAAFRIANPNGTITLAPWFMESAVMVLLLGSHVAGAVFEIIGTLGECTIANGPVALEYFVGLLPAVVMIHMFRRKIMDKHLLLSDLEHFDLSNAHCRDPLDREFICTAIREWYGSEDAFVRYVRGPIRNEVLKASVAATLPWKYFLLINTATISASLDMTWSLWRCGAPVEGMLSFFLGKVCGTQCFWFLTSLKSVLYLCDGFAVPLWLTKRAGCWADWFQSLWIFAIFYGMFFGGTWLGSAAYQDSLGLSLAWMTFSLLALLTVSNTCHGATRAR